MKDILRRMMEKRNENIVCGIASYCTSNELVIEAIIEEAKKTDDHVLIEATANQVNQFGGYTGMRPKDFVKMVYAIADRVGYDREQIILGGDHLGPLIWTDLPEAEAMKNSKDLVREYVLAGFKKIHLDTSMKLASDAQDEPLSDEVIARRGVELYVVCEAAYQELLKQNPCENRPVFIIGSEVPIPGGAQEKEDTIQVTKPEAFSGTVEVYRKAFEAQGIRDAFENIIAVVVQPGVEFGDSDVFHYDRIKAAQLCRELKNHTGLVFEGHSTDYQSSTDLREMVEDGIAILKVGPALTFALREGLFALSMIEKELIREGARANFIETLDNIMQESPNHWKKHYHGNDKELNLARKYSFSDRSRYYMNDARIEAARDRLFANLDAVDIPMSMLHQYMPVQYAKVRDKGLKNDARSLAKDNVISIVKDYNYAVKYKEQ